MATGPRSNGLFRAQHTIPFLFCAQVSLTNINITPAFLYAHIIVTNAANATQFITLNGLCGLFDEKQEKLAMLGHVPDWANFT